MSVIMASVVGIKPKPQFMGFFQFMGTHSGSPTTSENKSSEPDEGSELALTGWWRRGRVELLAHPPWRMHSVTFPKPWHNSRTL